MSLTKSTAGNRIILHDNVVPRLPSSTYTSAGPVVGDLLKNSSTGNALDHCANNDPPTYYLVSTNSGNGVLSAARLSPGVQLVADYASTVAVGDKVVCTGSRGTIVTGTDQVKTDNTNGVGTIIAKDANSPGGTGTCVIIF